MTWDDVKERFSELELSQQAVIAKTAGVEVPAEELAAAARAAEMASFIDQDLALGSKNDPTRAYVKTRGFKIGETEKGKPITARGLYLEVRALDFLCAFADNGGFNRLRDVARANGMNTSPALTAKK
jgi:hypothetical protein